MASSILKDPRRKKGTKKIPRDSPFPVPIESITKKEACDTRWFYYTGYFCGNCVVVEDLGDLTYLYKMGFFGKGNLSRSKPEHEATSDISQKAFSNSDRLRRLPQKERRIRQSKFRKIRKERHRNHFKWQQLANSTGENPIDAETQYNSTLSKQNKKIGQCTSNEMENIDDNECKKMKIDKEDDIDLCQDDSNDSDDDSDDISDDSNDDDQTDGNIAHQQSNANDDNTNKNSKSLKEKSKKKMEKKVDPYKVYEHLQLGLEEAFFLSYGLGCLRIYDHNKEEISISDAWRAFSQSKKNFVPCYIAYHYYRSKGWVPKCGIKYGTDFVIYKEGMPFYHSSYSVIVQTADSTSLEPSSIIADHCLPYTWPNLTGLNRVSEHAAKEIMICYVLVPSDITKEQLSRPCCIPRFEVKEVLLRRWVPERSREATTS